MQKVVEFLQKNPVQYLATVGRDGKAKCRPFMFCFEQDGKLWFCTNNTKDVYKDMLANPEVEVSVSSPEYAWIRIHGKAVFEDNKSVKEGCMNNPLNHLLAGIAVGSQAAIQIGEQNIEILAPDTDVVCTVRNGKQGFPGLFYLQVLFPAYLWSLSVPDYLSIF